VEADLLQAGAILHKLDRGEGDFLSQGLWAEWGSGRVGEWVKQFIGRLPFLISHLPFDEPESVKADRIRQGDYGALIVSSIRNGNEKWKTTNELFRLLATLALHPSPLRPFLIFPRSMKRLAQAVDPLPHARHQVPSSKPRTFQSHHGQSFDRR